MTILRALFIVLVAAGTSAAFAGVPRVSGGRTAGWAPAGHEPKTPSNSMVLPDRIIVRMAENVSRAGSADPRSAVPVVLQARSIERMFPSSQARPGAPDLSGFYVVRYDAPVDPFAAAAEISSAPGVEYAEPWFVYALSDAESYTPNDPGFVNQWYLRTVHADSAWDLQKSDSSVVIGFVDTGVQTDHPDLQAHRWVNPGEDGLDGGSNDKRTNNVDDDGNGKIDDWGGWDFGGEDYVAPSEDNAPVPTATNNAHGTHVAGIACAVPDNAAGIAGAGFNTRYLAVKATADNDTRGPGGTPFIIAGYQGIVYAAETGVDIISLSWGGPGYSQVEQDLINYVTSLGVLVVAAAGNTGSATELQYPASYDNVVSVAATRVADLKATYSSYNERVDVCAPGGEGSGSSNSIYSTYYPSTYAISSGTSMSTPLAAGIAALIRAHFPSFTPSQVGEQLRVTADTSVYPLNPSYRYKLGKGRVNAFRALTVTSPSVRMTSYTARDSVGGNNNGAFEVNEDVDIAMEFRNYLQPTGAGTLITLTSTDPSVTVTSGAFPAGAIPTGGTVSTAGNPFRVHVVPGIGPMRVVTFTLDISDGSYTDRQQFTLLFNPTFATHTVNNVWTTLTNNGRVGFQNFPTNTQGVGFIFAGRNQLFEGGLLLGTGPTRLVNVVRNPAGTQDADFTSGIAYSLGGPGAIADEEGSTYFADSTAPVGNRLNVRVTMNSYAWAAAPDDDYVIATYAVKNVSGAPIANLYAGLFADWDVHETSGLVNPGTYFDSNRTAFDAARGMGYVWYDTSGSTPHCGIVALEGAASFRALRNSATIDLSDVAKWGWISGGIVPDPAKGDVHHVVSAGPYSIGIGLSQKIAFALVGGNSLAELQATADAAIAKWAAIKTLTAVGDLPPGIPAAFTLEQNYPNPFNPSTTIRYGLPAAGRVRLTVYSILGEAVRTLIAGEERAPGFHEVAWDGRDEQGNTAASGVYLYRMEYADGGRNAFALSRKFVLMK